ncbi:MAG: hypothetical protein LBK60_12840 [Verrucomicrobiales bacterium]|jgi:hypothetical protein|nr:hypothetical protein [Verrucomicrobiales bacterium]
MKKLVGLTVVVTLTVSITRADVDVFTWTGTGGNNEWFNTDNWENQTLPTSAVTSGTREIVINNVANLPSLITGTVITTSSLTMVRKS